MKPKWKLQDAKAQFSKVVEDALKHGPQYVTRHGETAVVVVSAAEYEEMTTHRQSFGEFLLSCPKASTNLDLERKKDAPRKIEL
ncbi:MAG TPA: type II toxin-antitoxin system prevent-host-death family antitoxin [Candidatus Ozemobacteraceae bacterium]|nr:type II toxin-antitoxin system prevent-host-death family antitoxin [Candidatus Ozemobacteraceae bacterium]